MFKARYLTFPDVRLRIVGSFLTEFTAQGGRLNDLMGLAGNLIDCMIYEVLLAAFSPCAIAELLSVSGLYPPIYIVVMMITVALGSCAKLLTRQPIYLL